MPVVYLLLVIELAALPGFIIGVIVYGGRHSLLTNDTFRQRFGMLYEPYVTSARLWHSIAVARRLLMLIVAFIFANVRLR